MQINTFKHYGLLGIIILLLTIACTCGSPTEPLPVVEKEYPIYYFNRANSKGSYLFTYYPNTQNVDSTIIQWDPDALSVSSDGKLLYLTLSTSIVIIESETKSFVTELHYTTTDVIVSSPDNRMIAILGDTLRILRASDYQIIYSDSGLTYSGIFSNDSKEFYCGYRDTSSFYIVYKLDIANEQFSKSTKQILDRGIVSVKPTLDKSKWLLHDSYGFEVYDVAQDSIVFQDRLLNGYGNTALTKDGKKVFCTDPGRPGNPSTVDPIIKVYDVENYRIDKILDSLLLFSDDSSWLSNPKDLVITPDNKYVAVLGGATNYNVFFLFDVNTYELVDRINYLSNQYTLTNLGVQNTK